MSCDDVRAWLHAYLDMELDPLTSAKVDEHLRGCPACTATLAEQRAMQTIMKAEALYYKAPDHLRNRLRSALGEPAVERRARFAWHWVAAAACLVFLVGLGLFVGRWTLAPSGYERLTQEVTSAHIRSLQVEHKLDVTSSDGHKVKPWFNGKLDFAPPVPDLSDQRFILLGGRLDYLNDRPVAAVVYSRRAHVINLFAWPDPSNEDTAPRQETRHGYHLMHWSRNGLNHWVVSDLAPAELDELVQRLRE
jgi:anti-sigma factor RsiW